MKIFLHLKRKIVLVTLGTIAVVLAGIFTAVNISVYCSFTERALSFLDRLADADGRLPPQQKKVQEPPQKKVGGSIFYEYASATDFYMEYYSVKLDKDGRLIEFYSDFPDACTKEEVEGCLEFVGRSRKDRGAFSVYCFRRKRTDYGQLIVFLERPRECAFFRRLFFTTLDIYLISMVISTVAAAVLARVIARPVERLFANHKCFIANAGHELKTPIAVIRANISVLENEIPQNKWLDYIKSENLRMEKIVKDLIYLAKAETLPKDRKLSPCSLAEILESAALPFESVAFEQKKSLSWSADGPAMALCDYSEIQQLIVILLDNAIKNSFAGDSISLSLHSGASSATLKVRNTGPGIAPEDMDKIFDRFYRADLSRARTGDGGFGLGLAIAKSIARINNARLSAESEYGKWACFTLVIPTIRGGGG